MIRALKKFFALTTLTLTLPLILILTLPTAVMAFLIVSVFGTLCAISAMALDTIRDLP